jgi:transglutaminase-like putative cysteine protease
MQRVSAETALSAAASSESLNLDVRSLIPVDRLLATTSGRQQLVLDLSIQNGFLSDIPETAFQKTTRVDPSTVRIVLTTPVLPPARATSSFRPANQRAIPSTRWMPLADPLLQRMAATGAGSKTTDGEVCQQLERYVQSKMRHSAFSTTLVSANVVARTLRGDCTEHAVLLAALMRIKGIPSRVVGGLVHTNQQYGFTGHVWVEALVEDQWIPFDSTTGMHSNATTHVKLVHSDLSDDAAGAISLFLPVLDLAGRASVKVVSGQ